VVASFIGGGTGVPGDNHRHAESHWQTLSHNVSSTPSQPEWESNTQR